MGEVYVAKDVRLARQVAIKKLPRALASDPERIVRLEREAKLLAALNHPHIAAVYELDGSDGLRFLVMELVAGETLAQRLKAGQ
jgi:serine/threonine protein kinase